MSLNVTIIDDDPDFIRSANRRWEKCNTSRHKFNFIENPDDFFGQDTSSSEFTHVFLVDWDLGPHGFAVDFIARAQRKGYVAPFVVITTHLKKTQITGDQLVSTLDAGASNLLEKSIFEDWRILENHIEKEYKKFIMLYQHCHREIFERHLSMLGRPMENIRTTGFLLRAIDDLQTYQIRLKPARFEVSRDVGKGIADYLLAIGDSLPTCLLAESADVISKAGLSAGLNEKMELLAAEICRSLDPQTISEIDEILKIWMGRMDGVEIEHELDSNIKNLIDQFGPDLVVIAFLFRTSLLAKGNKYLTMGILRALRNSYHAFSYYQQSQDINSIRLQTMRELGRESDYLVELEWSKALASE
jgi:hypothetical protein